MATVVPPIFNDYDVRIVSTEVVPPIPQMQYLIYPLSNLDITMPPISFNVFFCYKNVWDRSFEYILSHLKNSLSRALATYYVFAGRLIRNSVGLPEILCNNQGAHSTQAYAATGLARLNLYNVEKTVQGKLPPPLLNDTDEKALPVFAVQVTEFNCGGIVVCCRFDHRVADGFSANMFLKCWANISSNLSNASENLIFSCSILRPRDPPTYSAEIENMYVKQPSGESGQETARSHSESRIYYLHAKDVTNLQVSANKNGNNYTKLEAFSGYLWKLLVSALDSKNTQKCRLGIVVDGRTRLSNNAISSNLFGNVLLAPFAECNAGDLKNKSHGWSVDLIHTTISSAANEKQFQSLIDLVETTKPASVLPKIYCKEDNEHRVMVSSGLRFPLYEVDHGWGQPAFARYHFPFPSETGYVMPTPSPVGDGSWVVYMYLNLEQLHAIESQPNCILHPITQDLILSL